MAPVEGSCVAGYIPVVIGLLGLVQGSCVAGYMGHVLQGIYIPVVIGLLGLVQGSCVGGDLCGIVCVSGKKLCR